MSPVCWSCTCMEGFMMRGWNLVHPGWRWLQEPVAISNQLVGLRFSHSARRYRPGGSPFSFPVYWSCTCMEGFFIRGWDVILSGCRCLHEPQPTTTEPVSLRFPHRAGRYRPGGPLLLSPVCWSCRYVEILSLIHI